MATQTNTTQRGYGSDHQTQRERWRPTVEAGRADCHAVICLAPQRRITPGEDWDLGHTPDRTAWTGPEHQRCNRSEGGRRGADVTNAKRTAPRHSRAW